MKNKAMLIEISKRQKERKIVLFTWQNRFQQIYTDCDALINMVLDLKLDLKQTKIANKALLERTAKRR